MGEIVEEVKLWNTPAIGAYFLWEFTKSYCEHHPSGDAPIGLLHFIVNALLTSKELSEPINNHRDNLQSYVRDFEKEKKSDLLLGIQTRVKARFKYTLACIDLAISKGLLVWDNDTGKIYPRQLSKQPSRGNNLKAILKKNGLKAAILGKWFAEHDLSTIATYLKVKF